MSIVVRGVLVYLDAKGRAKPDGGAPAKLDGAGASLQLVGTLTQQAPEHLRIPWRELRTQLQRSVEVVERGSDSRPLRANVPPRVARGDAPNLVQVVVEGVRPIDEIRGLIEEISELARFRGCEVPLDDSAGVLHVEQDG